MSPSVFSTHLSSVSLLVQALRADVRSFELQLPGSHRKENPRFATVTFEACWQFSASNFDFTVQHLFAEDYLMLLALSMIISITAVLHTYLSDIYLMSLPLEAISLASKDYSNRLTVVWRVDGVAIILSTLGTWIIKMNFMSFFYRLGHQLRAYVAVWWVAVVVIVACGVVILGIIPYDCVFEDSDWVNTHCSTTSKMDYIYSVYQANVALDVLSDLISEPITLSKPVSINIIKENFKPY